MCIGIYLRALSGFEKTRYKSFHQMGNRGPLSSAVRTFVIGQYLRGQLSSLAEGMIVAGVSKQTLARWLKAERIDWHAKRLLHLASQHRKAVMISEGKRVKRPTKKEQHLEADRLKRDWDKANAAKLEGIPSARG